MMGAMTTVATFRQLEQLQQWRCRPIRARGISAGIEAIDRRARLLQRRIGRFVEIWERVLPDALHQRTRVVAVRGGVAEVMVASSAIRFELDRRLRAGLLDTLRSQCGATLSSVRLRIGSLQGAIVIDSYRPQTTA
jgi:hypothetical protein